MEELEKNNIEINPVFVQLMKMLVIQNNACSTYLQHTKKRISIILDTLNNIKIVLSSGKNIEDFKIQTQEYEFFAKDVIENLSNLEKTIQDNEKSFLKLLVDKKIIDNENSWDNSNIIFGKNGGLSWTPEKKSCKPEK